MKKQSITIIRKGICFSLVTVSSLLNSLTSSATTGKDPIKQAQVRYLGKSNNYLNFNIDYPNKEQKKFIVQILDKDTDEVLYQREYKDSAFSKSIYLLVDDNDCTVTFRIKSGKNYFDQSFNINTQIKTVDDLAVTKL